eukprot:1154821-Prorocentrum_minimum.AAC.1
MPSPLIRLVHPVGICPLLSSDWSTVRCRGFRVCAPFRFPRRAPSGLCPSAGPAAPAAPGSAPPARSPPVASTPKPP